MTSVVTCLSDSLKHAWVAEKRVKVAQNELEMEFLFFALPCSQWWPSKTGLGSGLRLFSKAWAKELIVHAWMLRLEVLGTIQSKIPSNYGPFSCRYQDLMSGCFVVGLQGSNKKIGPKIKNIIGPSVKMYHSRPLFSLFSSFQNSKQIFNKFCQRLDSNHGPLVLEATALPTEPQPLPAILLQHWSVNKPKQPIIRS